MNGAHNYAIRHLPVAGGDGITGDFAHVSPMGDGRLLVLIGDVMGSGRAAGAAAAEAERIVQATVASAANPTEVLAALGDWVDTSLTDVLVTAMAVAIDAAGAEVTIASAGHPPALLVGADGATFLELDLDPPLGAGGALTRETKTWLLPEGSSLVLYTDGLVERRDASFDVGLEQLRRSVQAVALPPAALADHVIDAMGCTNGAGDDVAVVTVACR